MAEIIPFAGAQQARLEARLARLETSDAQMVARAYLSRAEDALKLLEAADTPREQELICQVVESWLQLAEAALA